MSDFLQWRERPWTIRLLAVVCLAGNAVDLAAGIDVWNAIVSGISLALLAGLWRGSPGVRLYYIVTTFLLLVLSSIALITEPAEHWKGFAASLAILGLLLAPPTHRWAEEREEKRERQRAEKRARARLEV